MNPYYYLFYKLNCFLNKKGNNQLGSIYALSILIVCNIVVIYGKLFHLTKANFKDGFKTWFIVIVIVLWITNSILLLNKRRQKEITSRYKGESVRRKKIGNLLVIFYIVLTLALIFFV